MHSTTPDVNTTNQVETTMSASQLNEFRKLAGLPIEESDSAAPVVGVTDVTSAVQAVEAPSKEVPAEVRKALKHAIETASSAAVEHAEKGQPGDAREQTIASVFATELDKMLDGTEEGFKRACEHLHSAVNHIVNTIPQVVVKYLSGNSQECMNSEEINKEGPRKHLRDYVNESRGK